MRLVIVESPYAGTSPAEVDSNVKYARRCLLDCLQRGEAPFASHLLYTQVLDDNDAAQRTFGIAAGNAWIRAADAIVVYTDHSITPGMHMGIAAARQAGIAIEYRRISPQTVP